MTSTVSRFLFTSRMKSVTRLTLDRELQAQFKRLRPGVVLDIGAKMSPYKDQIPSTKYLRLDIDPESNPDICSDIHEIQWEDNYFDTVILTETLEHLYEPNRAVCEIHRVMKSGGVCIASTRFIFPYHPDPNDYYRFTWDSLRHVFKDFSKVEIYTHGNRVQAIWQLVNYGRIKHVLNVFNPLISLIEFKNTQYPLGFVIYAVK